MARIITVNGSIEPGALGVTLAHEHLLNDERCWWLGEPSELSERHFVHQPVTLENRGEVIYRNFYNLDNLVQMDTEIAISEVSLFRRAGGDAIVDLTSDPLGRDPAAIRAISRATGIHVVMGCGRYVDSSMSAEQKKMAVDDIVKDIFAEFEHGVRHTGVFPGIIGEIGVSNLKNEAEVRSLKAAARAQKKLGCALNIHPPIWEQDGLKILDIIEAEGALMGKVALSHLDFTLAHPDYHEALGKRGIYLEYDTFGAEFMTSEGFFCPSDGDRIGIVKEMIRRGFGRKILLAGDMAFKIDFTKWGGFGYAHILRHIVPRFRQAGISDEQIEVMIRNNPREFLQF